MTLHILLSWDMNLLISETKGLNPKAKTKGLSPKASIMKGKYVVKVHDI
jgi:hypothetical protein